MLERRAHNWRGLIGLGAVVAGMVALVVLGAMVQPSFGPGGRFAAVGDAVRGWDKNILQWIGAGWLVLVPIVLVALLPTARRAPGGLARVTVALVLLAYAVVGIAMGVLIVASGQAASPPSGAGFRIGTSSGLKAAIGWILSPVPAWWVMSFWLERVRRTGPGG